MIKRISTINSLPSKIMRGQMWWADIPHDKCNPHAQSGLRPVVVISNDQGNLHSPSLLVCPLTTQEDKYKFIHPNVMCAGKLSYVQCEQIKVIDKSLLGQYIGKIRDVEQKFIDKALATSIDLVHYLNGYSDTKQELEEAKKIIGQLQAELDELKKQNIEYKMNEEMAQLGIHVKGIVDILFKPSTPIASPVSSLETVSSLTNIQQEVKKPAQPDRKSSQVSIRKPATGSERFQRRYQKFEELNSDKIQPKQRLGRPNATKWDDDRINLFLTDYAVLPSEDLLKKYDLRSLDTARKYYSKFKNRQSL